MLYPVDPQLCPVRSVTASYRGIGLYAVAQVAPPDACATASALDTMLRRIFTTQTQQQVAVPVLQSKFSLFHIVALIDTYRAVLVQSSLIRSAGPCSQSQSLRRRRFGTVHVSKSKPKRQFFPGPLCSQCLPFRSVPKNKSNKLPPVDTVFDR